MINSEATTKDITKNSMVKKSTSDLKWYAKNIYLHTKSSKGGIEEQKDMRQVENKHQNALRNAPISIIALTVKGLDAQLKRQKLPNWIKERNQTMSYLQETHLCSLT